MTKAYTDIEQSRKLAKILSLESADMWYWEFLTAPTYNDYSHPMFHKGEGVRNVPCWSLAALLDVLQKTAYSIDEDANVMLDSYKTVEWDLGINNSDLELITESNPVDACVKMIEKLHTENLI